MNTTKTNPRIFCLFACKDFMDERPPPHFKKWCHMSVNESFSSSCTKMNLPPNFFPSKMRGKWRKSYKKKITKQKQKTCGLRTVAWKDTTATCDHNYSCAMSDQRIRKLWGAVHFLISLKNLISDIKICILDSDTKKSNVLYKRLSEKTLEIFIDLK